MNALMLLPLRSYNLLLLGGKWYTRRTSIKILHLKKANAAVHLLDYNLQVAKLSRALQTKHLDLSLFSSLVDATLNLLDDAILPSANWVLQLQDASEELKAATGIEVTHLDICSIQRACKPFITRQR